MAEGKDLANLIPAVYYDLIARVFPGVPFLLFLLWDRRNGLPFPGNGASKLLVLVLAAYLVGIVFSSCAGLFLAAMKLILRRMSKARRRFSNQEILYVTFPLVDDAIGIVNREAGTTLAKVAAESILCENLLIGFIVLMVFNGVHPVQAIEGASTGLLFVIGAALIVAVAHRNMVYLLRCDRLFTLVKESKGQAKSVGT